MNTGTAGAFAELIVAASLMEKGYAVFRALSPSSPCDLIAYKDPQRLIRIEVRTGKLYKKGLCWSWSEKDEGRSDWLAVIDPATDTLRFYAPGARSKARPTEIWP